MIAIVRGGVQLTLVGLALRGVLKAPLTVILAILVMHTTASWTATRRLQAFVRVRRPVTLCLVGGAGAPRVTVFALNVLPFNARYVVALYGIVTGAR